MADSFDLRERAIAHLKGFATAGNVGPGGVDRQNPTAPSLTFLPSGLVTAYVVEGDQTIRYVQRRDQTAAGLSDADLFRYGIQNLGRLAEGVVVERHGPVFGVRLNGWSEASLLLLDSLWDETLNEFAPSGFVVAAPTRDVLAFCELGSREGLATLIQILRRVAGGHYPVVDGLLTRRESAWQRLAHRGSY